MTLKFLGDIEQSVTLDVATILDGIAERYTPFELRLQDTGAFPRLAQPRVIWAGIERHETLLKLHKDIDSALKPLGFETENRPFRGHLTLARLKGESWPEDLRQDFLESRSQCNGITFPVERLILYRSELRPGGAVYTPLHSSQFLNT